MNHQNCIQHLPTALLTDIALCAANPSASSATVSVIEAGVPDAKTIKAAAKAAKKAQEFNKAYGSDVVV